MRLAFLFVAAPLALASAAAAQAPVEVDRISRIGPNGDPQQIVCVRQRHIESPLNIRRICRTRAEWAELRRNLQQNVELMQIDRRN